MSKFSLGGFLATLIPGAATGLKTGLQYGIDFTRLEVKAFTTGNTAMQADLNTIRQAWLDEAANEAGAIKGDVIAAIEGGGDPFKGSRQLLQEFEKKYGKP